MVSVQFLCCQVTHRECLTRFRAMTDRHSSRAESMSEYWDFDLRAEYILSEIRAEDNVVEVILI